MKTPICLVVHTDTVFPELRLYNSGNIISGSLDNLIGIITVFRNLEFINNYSIPLYFTLGEEINFRGANDFATHDINKDTIPIIVDVGSVRKGFDCSVENLNRFEKKEIRSLKKYMEHHMDLRCQMKRFTGGPNDADDSWAFIEKGFKTLSYIIPVRDDFHTYHSSIDFHGIIRASYGLKWLMAYFLDDYVS